MKDPVNAMRDYKQALKIDNTYSLAYFNAANVYFHTRHFKQVSKMVEIVWYVYIILGICHHFATFQQHLHMESISLQLIQYSRACVSYHDFIDRGLLLTRKLLHQGLLVVKLKSSPWQIYSVCRNHNHKLYGVLLDSSISPKEIVNNHPI